MNKTAVKNFAVCARNKLIEEIKYKAGLLGITEKGIAEELPASTDTLKLYDISTKEPVKIEGGDIAKRKSLVSAIKSKAELMGYESAFENVVNEVAYTWFNRLIAVRFMEVNDYLPSGVRVLSSERAGKNEPDMVTSPFDTDMEFSEADRVAISTLKDDELFRFLFIKQCNKLNEVLPELFEKTDSYSEILLTLSFTDTDSVVYHLVHDIPEDDFNVEKEGQVQIIGWLYQYYNTEPKNEVFKALKSNVKISSENIPAATQLFTPDWIVRYMVENSLGRLWVDGHNDFDRSEWKYYLDEAEQNDEVKKQLAEMREEYKNIEPENIKFCDPCMGSGHILVYAFDVLIQIYLSRGYSEREAAAKIIRNNLYGLDIDKRAYQLAYFALMMKARQYDRRFLTRGIAPNLAHFQGLENIQNANVGGVLKEFVSQFKNCETYGSLMEVSEINGLDEAIGEFPGLIDLRVEQIEQMMRIYTVLSKKYDVVCTNPPYMGASNMNNTLLDFIKSKYIDYKSDFFSTFIIRCTKMTKPNGSLGFFTPYVWMFIQSYEKLRNYIYTQKTIETLIQFEYSAFEEATVPVCTFVLRNLRANKKGCYFRLTDFRGGMEVQCKKTLEAISDHNCGYYFEKSSDNFSKIPGAPVAYWVSENFIRAFENKKLYDYGRTCQGLATGDNNKFLRLWFECDVNNVFWDCQDSDESLASNKKWYPCTKGGSFRRWYGNSEYLVNWQNNGNELKNFSGSVIRNPSFYFRQSLTWSTISSGKFSMRYCPSGYIFESKGAKCFFDFDNILYFLGLLNTHVAQEMLSFLAPTLDYHEGPVSKIPTIISNIEKPKIVELAMENVDISQADWDSFETSWDFKAHPFIQYTLSPQKVAEEEQNGYLITNTLKQSYIAWKKSCEERFNKLKSNEEELNRIFIDIYGLQAELTPEVEDKDVTVRKAELERDIKSFISYAVGCMFGRYSLYKDGLIFAGEKYSLEKWVELNKFQNTISVEELNRAYRNEGITISELFFPGELPIIPITDDEYFSDDIVKRFVDFVETVYGKNTLEENLEFIANALKTKGDSPRRKIRNYFLGDFIKDHIKTYQKRPIYWLFDSGKQNGFKALVYIHRWDSNTIGNVRVEYLHKLQRIYESEIERMRETIDAADNSRDKANAEKRLDKLTKQLKETRDYDAKLSHLALESIDIDLDDGVKVNYEKVQTARDGKRLEILTPLK